jgi:hypothetical protein
MDMGGNVQNIENKPSFLRNHADTLAIIGVNIGIAALLVTLCISNSHRIDAVNVRSDALYTAVLNLMSEIKK